jgi:hypothetical protein
VTSVLVLNRLVAFEFRGVPLWRWGAFVSLLAAALSVFFIVALALDAYPAVTSLLLGVCGWGSYAAWLGVRR